MKPLATLDVEATGLNTTTDRIIELAFVFDDGRPPHQTLVDPARTIPEIVTQKTGITDAMVREAPLFCEIGTQVLEILRSHDLCGFNLWNFDLPIIWEELHRCGIEWDWTESNIIDAGVLFKKREERTLTAAARFYCGADHSGAHRAEADAAMTRRVLSGQLEKYRDLPMEGEWQAELAKVTRFEDRVDLSGKLARNSDGQVVFNFGAVDVRGLPVEQKPNLLEWMLGRDFPSETKMHCRRLLREIRGELL
jgi:DNA polymerase III subunit epsilon